MDVKKLAIALVLVVVATALVLCVLTNATCGVGSCLQVILAALLFLGAYLQAYNVALQLSLPESAVTGPLKEPPRLG